MFKPVYTLLLAIFFVFTFSLSQISAQSKGFRLHSRVKQGTLTFWAQNLSPAPIQVYLRIVDTHLIVAPRTIAQDFILPPHTSSDTLLHVQLRYADSSKVRYRYRHTWGDPQKAKIDRSYGYYIPYPEGEKHWIIQGYDGKFSHRRQFALDFKMKEGSKICAARSGIVVDLKEDSQKGGKTSDFARQANYLIIMHDDGSFAYYYHLQYEGVLVDLGQRVNAGEVVALSGNTGWSTTPHLHFAVREPHFRKLVSIPTLFYKRHLKPGYLKARRPYRARHPR